MRKYIHIPSTEQDAFLKMSEYAFSMNPQPPAEPEPPYALLRGVEVDGNLTAGAGLYPLTVLLKGAEIGVGGIGGVATWPQHRRRGHVAWLLEEMLKEMRALDLALSALWPFDWAFYRKYGWELCTTVLAAEVKTSDLNALPKPLGGQGELLVADLAALGAVNTLMAAQSQLMCLRSEDWLKIALKPWGKKAVTWCWREGGRITGYFICAKDKDNMIVHDMFWADESAMWGLFELVARHESQAEKVTFQHLPANHPLPALLANQYQEFRLKPLTMGRIVDVERLFSALSWPDVAGSLCLQVSDQWAPWNNHLFTLSLDGGRCAVSRGGKRADIELGIQQLTQLAVGFTDIDSLAAAKRITVHTQHKLLRALFPLQAPFFTERF